MMVWRGLNTALFTSFSLFYFSWKHLLFRIARMEPQFLVEEKGTVITNNRYDHLTKRISYHALRVNTSKSKSSPLRYLKLVQSSSRHMQIGSCDNQATWYIDEFTKRCHDTHCCTGKPRWGWDQEWHWQIENKSRQWTIEMKDLWVLLHPSSEGLSRSDHTVVHDDLDTTCYCRIKSNTQRRSAAFMKDEMILSSFKP